jgi:hypothetical protein
MSNIVYNTPMGNRVRLKNLSGMTEGGSDPNWTYNNTNSAGQGGSQGALWPAKIAAGSDGSIAVKFTGVQEAAIGFSSKDEKNSSTLR